MTTTNNCGVTTGADVKLYYVNDPCGCPGEPPVQPVNLRELNAGSRSLDENEDTVEAPNAYGKTCSRTFTTGGTATNPFDLCLGQNQELYDMAFGATQTCAPMVIDTASVIDAETYELANFDFDALNFLPGMTVDVAGFASDVNNGVKTVCEVNGSQIRVVACEGNEIAPPLVPEAAVADVEMTGQTISFGGNLQSNLSVYRYFPDVFNTQTQKIGVPQYATGGVITSFSLSATAGQFISGSMTIDLSSYERCTDQELPNVEEGDCDCENLILVDPRNVGALQVYYGCRPVCVTSFNLNATRPLDSTTTNCGITNTAGTIDVSFDFETSLEDSAFLCATSSCTGNGDADPLTVRINDIDPCTGEVIGWMSFVIPNPSFAAPSIDPDPDTALTQTISGTAQTYTPIDSPIFIQRSDMVAPAARNRVELTLTSSTASIGIGICEGETVVVDWGDGTIETFVSTALNLDTFTHTYADPNLEYDVVITAPDAECPIDEVSVGPLNEAVGYNYCYIRNQATELSFVGQDIPIASFVDFPVLETLRFANSSATQEIDISGSCALVDVNFGVNQLTEEAINDILSNLVGCGKFNGVLNLAGGGNAAPNAAGLALIAELQARGWTVTTN